MIKNILIKIMVGFVVMTFLTNISIGLVINNKNSNILADQDNNSIDDIGWYTSLDIDSNNNPHISYYHYTEGDLKYTFFNKINWITEIIDSSGDVGRYTSIAIDEFDNIHISYYDKTNGDLKYAYKQDGSWEIKKVDTNGNVGLFNCIALDQNNNPHISYVDYDNNFLKYTYWDGDSWVIEKVDENAGLGEYFSDTTSIVIDSSNRPHISYCSRENFDLKYAYFNGVDWNKQIIDSTGDVGQYSSMKLDSLGNPHIAYGSWTNFNLKYASFKNDNWNIETVDSQGDVRKWISLIFVNDKPMITYYDYTNGDLKIARFDETWDISIIDSEGAVGLFNSFAKKDNQLFVSFYSWSFKSLKFAEATIDSEFTVYTLEVATTNDFLDQSQYNCCGVAYGIEDTKPMAQSFIPTYPILTRVEIMLVRQFEPGSLTVSIRKDLDGEDLTSISVPANEMGVDLSWKLFDFPDISVNPGELYYLVCTSQETNIQDDMYYWYFDCHDPYVKGDAWMYRGSWKVLTDSNFPDIDLGFKSYGLDTYIPTIPEIDGPTNVNVGEICEYKFLSTDEDDDQLYYHIKWGEDDNEIIGPFLSGEQVTVEHVWSEKGTFSLKAKAVDINGAESNWGHLEVNVPRARYLLFERLFNLVKDFFQYLFIDFTYL
jgi:hypothetical protein